MAKARSHVWETVAIFLAIVAMWPAVFIRSENPIFKVILYVALLAMVVIFVRRWRRFHRLAAGVREMRKMRKGDSGRK